MNIAGIGRIRLVTLVSSVAYRNPAHLAKMAATVDVISRGRLTFGIGAGWFETEYRQYGWEFPPAPATRIHQMEEAIRLIKAMWTEPRTTFHGKHFHADDAILEPRPLRPLAPARFRSVCPPLFSRGLLLAEGSRRGWHEGGSARRAGGGA